MRRFKYLNLSDLSVVPIFINCSHYCHDHTTILTDVVLRPPRFWISSSCPAFVQLPTIKEQAWRDKSWLISNILFFLLHCVEYLAIPRPISPVKGTTGVQIHRRHPPHLRGKKMEKWNPLHLNLGWWRKNDWYGRNYTHISAAEHQCLRLLIVKVFHTIVNLQC